MDKAITDLVTSINNRLNGLASFPTREHLQMLKERLDMGIPLSDLIASGYVADVTVMGIEALQRTDELLKAAQEAIKADPRIKPVVMWYAINGPVKKPHNRSPEVP